MSRNVLVVADLRGTQFRNVTYEALGAATKIAEGGQVAALVIGFGVTDNAKMLGGFGAAQVYVADGDAYENYVPDHYLAALKAAVEEFHPQVVLLAHSAVGRDLAPMLAAHQKAGQASDVVNIEVEDGDVIYTRPIYAGKAFTKVKISSSLAIATVRPNNLAAPENTGAEASVVPLNVNLGTARSTIREVVKKAATGVDLTEAKIIVSGGRGVKSAEGFKPLEELAGVLGAAVGASRGACDAGYADYSLQVGQTGKVVTPDLYIACGISGAIQHLAGMSNSKVIVAINKDPEAPIFKVADYGIVADLFDVVPALTTAAQKFLAE